jgi:amino acid transporter
LLSTIFLGITSTLLFTFPFLYPLEKAINQPKSLEFIKASLHFTSASTIAGIITLVTFALSIAVIIINRQDKPINQKNTTNLKLKVGIVALSFLVFPFFFIFLFRVSSAPYSRNPYAEHKSANLLIENKKFDWAMAYYKFSNDRKFEFLEYFISEEDLEEFKAYETSKSTQEWGLYLVKKDGQDCIYLKEGLFVTAEVWIIKGSICQYNNLRELKDFTFLANDELNYDEIITNIENKYEVTLNLEYFLLTGDDEQKGIFFRITSSESEPLKWYYRQ